MQFLAILIIAAIIFGVCRLVDIIFTKLFRSKAQHRSGLAVRANKRYGIFGVILTILGILGMMNGPKDKVLFFAGMAVALLGIGLITHYLSFGIFYDGETFLVCRFGKKNEEYAFKDIVSQQLFVVTGGSTVIDLTLAGGGNVTLQSTMDGVYPFMDTAFAAWCMAKGISAEECDFYDSAKSWWFPHGEEA